MSVEMTIDEAIELGRAWAEAGWAWKRLQPAVGPDGKTWIVSIVDIADETDPDIYLLDSADDLHCFSLGDIVPDPRDPGFIGHALAQVREAWSRRCPCADVLIDFTELRGGEGVGANVEVMCSAPGGYGETLFDQTHPSLVEALLAARRAAP